MTDEHDQAFMATVALFPHGQIWYYAHDIASWCPTHIAFLGMPAVYTCTASFEDPPTWTPPTSLRLLSLRYMEDEANDRGLNHENTS